MPNPINSEIEQEKLQLLGSSVERQDPSTKDIDDDTLRRFLRARDFDIEKASAMLIKYLKWKRELVPKGFVSETEISYDLTQKKMFLQGTDKEGRPIAVFLAAKHFPNKGKGSLDETKRYLVYTLDKVCSRIPQGQDKFLVIADLQGWGYSNFDLRGGRGTLSILQDCYPERLEKFFLVNVPSIFAAAWKMFYPFIDNNTKAKIIFVEKKKLTSTLLEYIDESQLPVAYGGKLSPVAIEDC